MHDAEPMARDFLTRLAGLLIRAIEAERKAECRTAAPGSSEAKIVQLTRLKGVTVTGGQVLVKEVFYRRFANRLQVVLLAQIQTS